MKQKVITIRYSVNKDEEEEHPKLNKYLEEGWQVKSVHQISTSTAGSGASANGSISRVYATFILEHEA